MAEDDIVALMKKVYPDWNDASKNDDAQFWVFGRHLVTEKCLENAATVANVCPSNTALYGKLNEALEALVQTCYDIENPTEATEPPTPFYVDENVVMFPNNYKTYLVGDPVPTTPDHLIPYPTGYWIMQATGYVLVISTKEGSNWIVESNMEVTVRNTGIESKLSVVSTQDIYLDSSLVL